MTHMRHSTQDTKATGQRVAQGIVIASGLSFSTTKVFSSFTPLGPDLAT